MTVRIAYSDALTKEEASDLMKKNEESVRLSTETLAKIYLVNFIPMRTLMSSLLEPFTHPCFTLKYIPAWVPGAGFQRLAAHIKSLNYAIHNGPWEKVLRDIVNPPHPALDSSQEVVELWDSSTQPGEQTDRALRCEWASARFSSACLYR